MWKTPDQKPEPNRTIVVKIAQTTFCIDYTTVKGMEILPNFEKWCYLDDLIAQADKAERLQKVLPDVIEYIDGKRDYFSAIGGDIERENNLIDEIKQLTKEQ